MSPADSLEHFMLNLPQTTQSSITSDTYESSAAHRLFIYVTARQTTLPASTGFTANRSRPFSDILEDKLNELAQANQTHRVLPKWLNEDELYRRAIALSPPDSPKMSLTPSETGSPPPYLDQISPQERSQSPITTPSRAPSIRRSSTAEPPHASHKPTRITKNTSKKTRRSAGNTKASRRRVHQMVTRSMAQQTKLREFG